MRIALISDIHGNLVSLEAILADINREQVDQIICFHGSPRSSLDRILATTPTAELDKMLGGHTATVMACGHTHVQMLRQHKGMLIVNVGSVGQPFEQRPFEDEPRLLPCAQYAIVNRVTGALGIICAVFPLISTRSNKRR